MTFYELMETYRLKYIHQIFYVLLIIFLLQVLFSGITYYEFLVSFGELLESITFYFTTDFAVNVVSTWGYMILGLFWKQAGLSAVLLSVGYTFIVICASYLDFTDLVYLKLSGKIGLKNIFTLASTAKRSTDKKYKQRLYFHVWFAALLTILIGVYRANHLGNMALGTFLQIVAILVIAYFVISNMIWLKGATFDKRKTRSFIKVITYHGLKKTLNFLVVVFIAIYLFIPVTSLVYDYCYEILMEGQEERMAVVLSGFTVDNLALLRRETTRYSDSGEITSVVYEKDTVSAERYKLELEQQYKEVMGAFDGYFALAKLEGYWAHVPILTSAMPIVILIDLIVWFVIPFVIYARRELVLDLCRKAISILVAVFFNVLLEKIFHWDTSSLTKLSLFFIVFIFTEYFLKVIFKEFSDH